MIGFPHVCAPVAVVQPVAPVNMMAIEQIAYIGAVVAALQGVRDRAAVHGVFCAAFEVCVEYVVTVLAEVAVEAVVAVF